MLIVRVFCTLYYNLSSYLADAFFKATYKEISFKVTLTKPENTRFEPGIFRLVYFSTPEPLSHLQKYKSAFICATNHFNNK